MFERKNRPNLGFWSKQKVTILSLGTRDAFVDQTPKVGLFFNNTLSPKDTAQDLGERVSVCLESVTRSVFWRHLPIRFIFFYIFVNCHWRSGNVFTPGQRVVRVVGSRSCLEPPGDQEWAQNDMCLQNIIYNYSCADSPCTGSQQTNLVQIKTPLLREALCKWPCRDPITLL